MEIYIPINDYMELLEVKEAVCSNIIDIDGKKYVKLVGSTEWVSNKFFTIITENEYIILILSE